MATKDEQETLRRLVQHVSRAFYEPKYTIILDQLARNPVLKDDDLAGRLGLQSKELNKLMAVLSNDRLVHIYRQNELKEGAQRAVAKQYYYIDYQHFCNVVKWRIAKMYSIIESTLRNELDNKGYICPQCNKSYLALDAVQLWDPARGAFICEICHAELVDNENTESVKGSQDRMQRFNKQMWFITKGLQKSETMVIPAFDVPLWVKNNLSDADKQKAAQSGSVLKVAGSGPGTRNEDDGIGVMMSMDKDESTQKLEREAEAAAKRQQNALPEWHLKSTISGDLTALGIQEHARAETAAAAAAAASISNDDVLKGLGVVGSARLDRVIPNTLVEDVKPLVSREADYYDQYYASLAASSAPSTQATPSGIGASESDDFGDFPDDEEDQKPSVEYLDSLNDYRKRSRSREDDGIGQKKVAKTGPTYFDGLAISNGDFGGKLNGEVGSPMVQEVVPGDDPIVYVNGAPKPFSKVTEEDQDLMTPEEYTTYFEVFQDRG